MKAKIVENHIANPNNIQKFGIILRHILQSASSGIPRTAFLSKISNVILESSGCDLIELRLEERDKIFINRSVKNDRLQDDFKVIPRAEHPDVSSRSVLSDDSAIEWLFHIIRTGQYETTLPFFTKNGSFWTGDTRTPLRIDLKIENKRRNFTLEMGSDFLSLALIPFDEGLNNTGFVQLASTQPNFFTPEDIRFYEGVAQAVGHAATDRRMHVSLRERVKELTCLYNIARLVERPNISLGELLQEIVEILPPSWLYPEAAHARITLDDITYSTAGYRDEGQKQISDIILQGMLRGTVEVIYIEEKPELDEGPFLKEERDLIDSVAREIAIIIERKISEEEKGTLQDQLRHADRLATIGQLAAGVAHELNEPLSSILGFAQLIKKTSDLPEQTALDTEKIVSSCLYAREIIKNLLFFSRQLPSERTTVDVNRIIKEAAYFPEARCAKTGITVIYELSPAVPEIVADQAQMHQVIINLVVNAIQAMPEGGSLFIRTEGHDDHVSLIVEDTGIGMTEEVKKQIFLPFYTTKDIGEGTGLGLPVVHGIVTSHGGSIEVESSIGRGSRFIVKLPVEHSPEGENHG